MLEYIRSGLRIKTTSFDTEINTVIEAWEKDMGIAGVTVIDTSDEMCMLSALLYAKAYFGYNDEADRWLACYEKMRDTMALSGDYGYVHDSSEDNSSDESSEESSDESSEESTDDTET